VHWIWILLLLVWAAPNTQQLFASYRPALNVPHEPAARILWRPTALAACLVAAMAIASIVNLTRHSEFLYFQF
jgi:hypothetical protein